MKAITAEETIPTKEVSKGKFSTPPKHFVNGTHCVWAQFAPEPPSFLNLHKRKQIKGRRKQGINYEAKAQEYLIKEIENKNGNETKALLNLLNFQYIKSPWLVYKLGSDPKQVMRYCQPDGLIINGDEKRITIVEIKLQHTSDSWWQTRQLYEPICKQIYPYHSFSILELVCWLDPNVAFPETFRYASNVFDVAKGDFGVHIYRPRNSQRNGIHKK